MPLFESFYKTLSMHDAKVQPKDTTGQKTLKHTLLQKKQFKITYGFKDMPKLLKSLI